MYTTEEFILLKYTILSSMMTSFTVSSGRIPAVGYGCWKVPRDSATELVEGVIRAGYRHIDGACDYGNEKEVSGSLIRREFD